MPYQQMVITEFGGPEVLKMVEEPQLPEPKPGEVRVRVLATGANFTDTMIRKGIYPDVKDQPPFAPGYDMVGIVDKLGEGVKELSVGQMVAELTVIGAYSEYLCLAQERLVPVPDGLDPAEAVSLVLTYVTAYQMLHRIAAVKDGQSILVHGAGGAVGSALLQLGKLHNLTMYATASTPKHGLIMELGGVPIDYRTQDFVEVIRSAQPEGIDAAFDAIGGENFKRSFKTLKRGGTLVPYGFYNASTGRGGSVPLGFMQAMLLNLLPNGRASKFYSIAPLRKQQPDWFEEDLKHLFKLLKDGKIKPVIAERMPLSRAVEAHQRIEDRAVKGKLILMVGEK